MKTPEQMFNFVRKKLGTVEAIAEGRLFGSLSELQALVRSCHDVAETIVELKDLTEDGYEFFTELRDLNDMVKGQSAYSLDSLSTQIKKCEALVGKKMFK